MEFSPLRFLDLDVSLMLADEVRNSQEEEVVLEPRPYV